MCTVASSHLCAYGTGFGMGTDSANVNLSISLDEIIHISLSNINQKIAKQSVTFVWILIRTNIRIYSCQENDTNEYPNIFG